MIEAALEDLELKRTVFRVLDAAAAPDAILATNTSALTICRDRGGDRPAGAGPRAALLQPRAGDAASSRSCSGPGDVGVGRRSCRRPRRELGPRAGRLRRLARASSSTASTGRSRSRRWRRLGARRGGRRGDRRGGSRCRLPDGPVRADGPRRNRRHLAAARGVWRGVRQGRAIPAVANPGAAASRRAARAKVGPRLLPLRRRHVRGSVDVGVPDAPPGATAPDDRRAHRARDPRGGVARPRRRDRDRTRHRHRDAARARAIASGCFNEPRSFRRPGGASRRAPRDAKPGPRFEIRRSCSTQPRPAGRRRPERGRSAALSLAILLAAGCASPSPSPSERRRERARRARTPSRPRRASTSRRSSTRTARGSAFASRLRRPTACGAGSRSSRRSSLPAGTTRPRRTSTNRRSARRARSSSAPSATSPARRLTPTSSSLTWPGPGARWWTCRWARSSPLGTRRRARRLRAEALRDRSLHRHEVRDQATRRHRDAWCVARGWLRLAGRCAGAIRSTRPAG